MGCDDVTLAKRFLKHCGALIFKKKFLLEVFDPEDEGTTCLKSLESLSQEQSVTSQKM